MTFIDKCIKWNADRYCQSYDHKLSCDLLAEEMKELDIALSKKDPIETLDAIGDVSFVAIGILWKLEYSKEVIESLFTEELLTTKLKDLDDLADVFYAKLITGYLVRGDSSNVTVNRLIILKRIVHALFYVCIPTLQALGMQNKYFDVIDIICKSNDTKVLDLVGKTSPGIKANRTKGAYYVAPTQDLFALYRNRGN